MTIRLIEAERVEMRAYPTEANPPESGHAGYWVELEDAERQRLYSLLLHDPIRDYVEVPGDGGSFERSRSGVAKGFFTCIVPDIPESRTLVLYGSDIDERAAPAKPIFRADLREIRR